MFRGIFTYGGFTLLSRIAGFARDIVMAAILGAGPLADAFVVAQRLPNHFRTIFAEGAFNAAFIPAYAHLRGSAGEMAARRFADRIFTMLLMVQGLLLLLALVFMPQIITLLAPGFAEDPERRSLAIELTRITFPYLLLITVVTLYGAILNVMNRYASAAAAPILLNLSVIVALMLAVFFPSAGHAAAWGVLIAGVLEVLLLATDAGRQGVLPRLTWPQFDSDVRGFFRALGPATLGSMGPQIAVLADTIIGSFLATGALAALYYADRLNQLPIGVIGVAAGTVLLPEMSRRLAVGDAAGAINAQRRVFDLTLLLSVPFLVAFMVVPDIIMRAMFARGAFSQADAANAARTLAAYAVGLLPFVLIRSVVASFQARKDTATPAKAALIGVGFNLAAKLALVGSLAQAGLALGTALGAWVNLLVVFVLAVRAKYIAFDRPLQGALLRFAGAGVVLALALWMTAHVAAPWLLAGWHAGRDELTLGLLIVVGAIAYPAAILLLFGRRWLAAFVRR
jgi:putative peptidoglycan lipid II flippase